MYSSKNKKFFTIQLHFLYFSFVISFITVLIKNSEAFHWIYSPVYHHTTPHFLLLEDSGSKGACTHLPRTFPSHTSRWLIDLLDFIRSRRGVWEVPRGHHRWVQIDQLKASLTECSLQTLCNVPYITKYSTQGFESSLVIVFHVMRARVSLSTCTFISVCIRPRVFMFLGIFHRRFSIHGNGNFMICKMDKS